MIDTRAIRSVIIYTRVSKDRQKLQRSVEEQETDGRRWQEREGWTLVDRVYSDNDRSASPYARKDRPDWTLLMDRLQRGDIDALILWEPSRGTRDMDTWRALARICKTHGIRIGINGRVYDLEDPEDEFQLDLFFSLAQREAAVTRKRVKRNVDANAAAGRPTGRCAWGYKRLYDPSNGALLTQNLDPEISPLVREAGERVLCGESRYAIEKDWAERGIVRPGGKPWTGGLIKAMLMRPVYAGLRELRGDVIGEGNWPGILTVEERDRLVAMLTDPKRRAHRDGKVKHLLSGIAVCGKCKLPVKAHPNQNPGRSTYVCINGFHVSKIQGKVDLMVNRWMINMLECMTPADIADDSEAVHSEISALEQLIDQREEEAADVFTDLGLSATMQEIKFKAIAGAIETLKTRLAEKRSAVAASVAGDPLLLSTMGPGAGNRWKFLPLDKKRHLIRLTVEVQLMPDLERRNGKTMFKAELVEIRRILAERSV